MEEKLQSSPEMDELVPDEKLRDSGEEAKMATGQSPAGKYATLYILNSWH